MSAFFRFAAETALAHAEALKHPEQEPNADNMGGPFGTPASAQDLTPSPSCSVIVLDAHRKTA